MTDDRAAIQAAIDDAGGKPLYFPPPPDGWAIGSPLRLRRATHLVGDHTPSYFPPNFRPSYIKALPAFTGACVAHHLNDGFVTHVQTASIQYVSCRAEWCASAGFVAFDGDKVTYEGCFTDRNGNSGWHIDVGANDRPLVLSHCYANRDGRNGAGLSGVRIVSGSSW